MFMTLILTAGAAVQAPPPPQATFNTGRTGEAVAQCLSQSWGPVSVVRRGEKVAIKSKDGLDVDVIGSTVNVRRVPPIDGPGKTRVQACLS